MPAAASARRALASFSQPVVQRGVVRELDHVAGGPGARGQQRQHGLAGRVVPRRRQRDAEAVHPFPGRAGDVAHVGGNRDAGRRRRHSAARERGGVLVEARMPANARRERGRGHPAGSPDGGGRRPPQQLDRRVVTQPRRDGHLAVDRPEPQRHRGTRHRSRTSAAAQLRVHRPGSHQRRRQNAVGCRAPGPARARDDREIDRVEVADDPGGHHGDVREPAADESSARPPGRPAVRAHDRHGPRAPHERSQAAIARHAEARHVTERQVVQQQRP